MDVLTRLMLLHAALQRLAVADAVKEGQLKHWHSFILVLCCWSVNKTISLCKLLNSL